MQITFNGHEIDAITPALKEFVTNKFDRLERHYNRISRINVSFSKEKQSHIVEATIFIPGEQLHASSESEDMYSAIDLLLDKLDRQLKKHKEMETDHK